MTIEEALREAYRAGWTAYADAEGSLRAGDSESEDELVERLLPDLD